MKKISRSFTATLSLLLSWAVVAGCSAPAREYGSMDTPRKPVEVTRGLAQFVEYCYQTGPQFKTAAKKARANGFEKQPNGWLEHPEYHVDVVVRDHGDYVNCQFIFATTQTKQAFAAEMRTPFNATMHSAERFIKNYAPEAAHSAHAKRIDRAYVSQTTLAGGTDALMMAQSYKYKVQTEGSGPNESNIFGIILRAYK